MLTLAAAAVGCVLDLIFGDPIKFPHIVVGIGKAITGLEKLLRRVFGKTERGELYAGLVLALTVPIFSCAAVWGILALCDMAHPVLRLAVEGFFCWQCLAARTLYNAGRTVAAAIESGDIEESRRAIAMFVGRDTDRLSNSDVARACVETIAENTSDGVIAPLFFIMLGGAPLGVFYKAINTLDSMVGYKNEKYLYFGRASAILDDIVNFIPARIAGLLTVLAAGICRYDMKGSLRIFRCDRRNHKSPNSAQTESACAGALGIRLGGDNYYFGELVHKPTIGDDTRPVDIKDIGRASRLMLVSSGVFFILSAAIRGVIVWLCWYMAATPPVIY